MKIITLLALILCIANAISLFNLQVLNKTNGAMCMDGSPYGIYTFIPDDETPKNKLMIFFEEIWEGWCPKEDLNSSLTHC